MPLAALTFRARCGGFLPVFLAFMGKRASEKAAMKMAKLTPRCRLHGVLLGMLLTLLFWGGLLLQCGDIEQNPGPASSSSSGASASKADSSRKTRQSSISFEKTGSTSDSKQSTSSVGALSLEDVMAELNSIKNRMNSGFSDLEKSVKDINSKFMSLQGEVLGLREEVSVLKQKNKELTDVNADLLTKLDTLEQKTDDLEGRSKRNNLIFHGIPRRSGETSDDCEGLIQDLLTDKLDINDTVQFDRVHRLGGRPDSPIIARCCFYKDKVKILKAKKKLQGSNQFIGEDFSMRVREIRRQLAPHLKAARNNGQRCVMVFDHLIIEGKKFLLDTTGSLKEER